jgi:hypothetical protein
MNNTNPPTRIEPQYASLPARLVCHACRKSIDPSFGYCPHCGRRQAQIKGESWYHHPVWILVLALFAIGPFALIPLWQSRKMDTAMRVLLTIVIGVYSYLTFYALYQLSLLMYREYSQLIGVVGSLN